MNKQRGIAEGAFIFIIGCLAIAAVLAIGFGLDYWQCDGYGRATGKPIKYVAGTCYIQQDGNWFAWEEYKFRFVTKGEMK